MEFKLTFDMNNAAFADQLHHSEAARIIDEVAKRVRAGHESGTVSDVNGNKVGEFAITNIPEFCDECGANTDDGPHKPSCYHTDCDEDDQEVHGCKAAS